MAARHTQEPIEVVTSPTSVKARVTQEPIEVVTSPTSVKARVTQEPIEVVIANVINATQELTGTLSIAGSLVSQVGRSFGGTEAPSGALASQVAKSFAGTEAPTGALANTQTRTRMWFSQTNPPVAPAFHASWTTTSKAVRMKLNHTKGASTAQIGSRISWPGSAGSSGLDRQLVSFPLDGAQTIGGQVKMQLQVREFASGDNVDQLIIVVRVFSVDGGTLRGTLLTFGSYGPTGEFLFSGTRNKIGADGDVATPVAALSGDRIVVDIGYSNSTGGASPEGSAIWGEDVADLPESDETQTTLGAGWIEFAGTLAFSLEGTSSITTSGTISPAGVLVKQAGKFPVGTITLSGSNTNRLTALRSFAGTLTSSGAAIILQVFLASGLGGTLTLAGTVVNLFGRAVSAAGTLTSSGALIRFVDKVIGVAGTLTSTGALIRQAGKAIDAELVTAGAVAVLKLFNIAAAGTLTMAGSLVRTAGKKLSGVLTTAGAMGRVFGKYLSGILTFLGLARIVKVTGGAEVCDLVLADLVARIYERLDEDRVYYTESEVLHALDLSQRLFAWLTLCVEHRASFSLINGETFYSGADGIRSQIPDFWAPLRVSLQSNGARLLPMTLDDLDRLDETWQSTPGTARYYCTMGFDFMAIYPQPAAGVSLHFTYAAEPQPIISMASSLDVPSDQLPLLVDAAIWILRLKEGSTELSNTLEGLGRFVAGAQKYRSYTEARSQAQSYDKTPVELTHFDLSRFMFRPLKKGRVV